MDGPLRIAQVTDIHISPDESVWHYESLGDIDARKQFLQALAQINEYHPDLLVISGDLAADKGEIASYLWIKEQLANLSYPYVVMTGNHDILDNMRQVFNLEHDIHNGQLYFRRDIKQQCLLFLDTANYQLPAAQIAWVQRQCANLEEVLLFIHHPPLLCGCRFMDTRHSLKNIAVAWPALCDIPQIKHIFCGHYHTERHIFLPGKNIHLAPSTMMQIHPHTENFAVDHIKPGWQAIECDKNGVKTQVYYAVEA